MKLPKESIPNMSTHAKLIPMLMAFLGTLLFSSSKAQSNKDTLFFKGANEMIGEIKSLDRGVLMIETDYSDKDFAVEWINVKSIRSSSSFLITLQDGRRLNGWLYSKNLNDTITITGRGAKETKLSAIDIPIRQIVFLQSVEDKFWSRLSATVDIGFNLTKANNLSQLNGKITGSYSADRFHLDAFIQELRSRQDSIAQTVRTEGGIGFQYFLPKDWYTGVSLNFLSNTEQAIKLRTTGRIGVGKYILHTNRKYWSTGGGLNINNESFTNETPGRNSLEAFVATELNLFDIGDLNLLSNIFVYRSLTEAKRWRTDIKMDLKYDLPLDFYIKVGGTINYDNQPAIKGNETDYVFNFGFGWEFN